MSVWLNATFHSFSPPENFSNTTFSLRNGACDVLDNSFSVRIGLILVFSMILMFSLFGNALIIVIVYKRKELKKTTNYFIVNMAVSDFVYPLTIIPIRLAQIVSSSMQWPIGGLIGLILCKVINFLRHTSFAVSTGSLVCIALDRFLAVVFPMKVQLISSRFRTFAIAAIWILAVTVNSLNFYAYKLVEKNEETICTYLENTAFSYRRYHFVRTILFIVAPLVATTTLYCVIAVTLRKKHKTLRGSSVHQKDQRKQQAIKMTLCVIAAFYICNIPTLISLLFDESQITISCSFSKVLWALVRVTFYLSTTVNPIICMTFVKSYRQGFKEVTMCWKNCLTTGKNMENDEPEEINLQDIRIIPGIGENLAFSET
ncbi:QRFP-like peptide receptor [Oculina patagonica]